MNTPLRHAASNYINGQWRLIEGEQIRSHNPAAPDEIVWTGSPDPAHVDEAVKAARAAFPEWAALSMNERIDALRKWQVVTGKYAESLAGLITAEMGKIHAESLFEAKALAGKVDVTLDDISLNRVRDYEVAVSRTRAGHCRFKPHGVMAVIGPFNFPAHLANGHFVPALLTGNTIVFKPSEKTPAVGQMIAEMMDEAQLPPGVFNLVQGGGDIAASLVDHDDTDGILFTGSWPVGRRILEANLDRPGRIVALEMGGNNPAVVLNDAHLNQAVIECVRASFATTGQRCTCTRRIIVQSGIAERFIPAFVKAASTLVIGPGDTKTPVFMGPLVTEEAADAVITYQRDLAQRGGKVLLEAARIDQPGHFVTPGVVKVDRFTLKNDQECFGPLAQISIVDSLDEAIEQANATEYGLAASIFTATDLDFERFFRECRSGCINHNTGTAGASSKLPFGGLGKSGNHRPAAAFSVDYCAYPVASMAEEGSDAAVPEGMQWDDSWTEGVTSARG
ncbi:MAG: aldehyde dehydrogenase family protein [Phycisphaerales bacterium]|nr:MAG: aldehyde dehydrogenase family protein [Phycisphaerales bacterium]